MAIVTFKLLQHVPRRKARNRETVKVKVLVDGETYDVLWMSKKDIAENLKDFHSHELQEMLELDNV